MHAKVISYFSVTLFPLFIMGCEVKNKGEIIAEHHKNVTEFYLVNNSPNETIQFTILMSEKTNTEKIYLTNKKTILDTDSTNETAIIKLAPGARQYMGTAHDSDTSKFDAQDNSITYSADSTTLGRYSPQHKGIIITNKSRLFKIVGATTK